MAENSSIIICDQKFDVGRRVITWQDDPKISAYTPHCVSNPGIYPTSPAKGLGQIANRFRPRRLLGADRSLSRFQQILKQFVIHHDGMGTSRDCFRVLHDERGLSVHFLLDNNGDIYQTLDLVECAFQAAGVNEIAVGVELCSRGDKIEPGTYPAALYKQYPREPVTCGINGHQWLAWSYTKEQYDSMIAIGRTLARIFPGLPQTFPNVGGDPLWATIAGDAREFAGYLGHYHVTNQKWDPGPFDFQRFVQNIRGRVFYPALPGKEKAELPDEKAPAEATALELYDNNEKEGEGGYFPVGPGVLGTRMWHGGLHLREDRGKALVSPFAGKLVLARFKKEDEWATVGSPNLVLIRHDLTVGAPIRFFTLLMHLDAEDKPDRMPPWMKAGMEKKWWKDLSAGEVVQLDQPVAAGEVVGHFGEAGKPSGWKGQVHFEVFAEEEIGEKVEPGFWKAIDGSKDGRFCNQPLIVAPIDKDRNRFLAPSEITSFFHGNKAREDFRKFAVRHLSDWSDRNDWEIVLNKAVDVKGWWGPKIHKIYADQIEPFLWWKEATTVEGLPADMIVWGYHPITFVKWLHDRMQGGPQNDKAIGDKASYDASKRPPADIKDDSAEGAGGFTDDEDSLFGEAAKSLDLEKLANGYPEEK